MPSPRPSTVGRVFSVVALVEAFTWAGLLVGMFLKYVTETTDQGVWLFGRLHGGVFVLYVVVALVTAVRLRWSWKVAFVALAASVPPLMTLVFEVWARRHHLLAAPEHRTAGAALPSSSVESDRDDDSVRV